MLEQNKEKTAILPNRPATAIDIDTGTSRIPERKGSSDTNLTDVPVERREKLPGREEQQVPLKKERLPGAEERLA